MKLSDSITLMVYLHLGRSFYWSVPLWRLLLWGGMLALFLIFLLVGSIGYLFVYGRLHETKGRLADLEQQIQTLEQRAFLANKRAWELRLTSPTSLTQQQSSDEGYQPPLLLKSASAWVSRSSVELEFILALRQPGEYPQLSGTLIAVLANEDVVPAHYIALPKSEVNARGFPLNRFAGAYFYQARREVRFRRKLNLTVDEDYFTQVSLFVFSLRGGFFGINGF